MEQFMTPEFWLAVGQIILLDIVLGGDNAVVIALACRKLPPEQRKLGIFWGTAGAIILRVALIVVAWKLLELPYLKLVGAVLLVWIGYKLMLPEEDAHGNIEGSDKLWGAVKTVIVADLVMSIDNVIAIAAAAESAGGDHKTALVIFGLLVSIPIIVWGSQFVIKMMDRFPIIITAGAMLLGWIAGGMAISDPAVLPHVPTHPPAKPGGLPTVVAQWSYLASAAGALLVLAIGKWLGARQAQVAQSKAE
jgi:YjbE family integral membrane protein